MDIDVDIDVDADIDLVHLNASFLLQPTVCLEGKVHDKMMQ